MPMIDFTWIGWLKFWVLVALAIWAALMAGFFFVLPEEKKAIVREKWGDPADCPRIIWGWFSEATTAIWKVIKGATLATSEIVPDTAQSPTVAALPEEPLTFDKLRELTSGDSAQHADYYLNQADMLIGKMRYEALPADLDAERIARLVIAIDKLAAVKGYDLEAAMRKALAS